MRLHRADVIAGQPIKRVRDWLRKTKGPWARSSISTYFDLSDPTELISELEQRQLVTKPEADTAAGEQLYHPGPLADRFAAANLLDPISRLDADALLTDLLTRIVAVNDNPDLLVSVAEARVFGSYLDPSGQDLSDVDVALRLQKKLSIDEYVELSMERGRASGKCLVYPELINEY